MPAIDEISLRPYGVDRLLFDIDDEFSDFHPVSQGEEPFLAD